MPIVTQAKSTPFIDSSNLLKNAGDPTKTARFSLSGLTTGATRVLTLQDANGTLPLLERANVFTLGPQTFNSGGASNVAAIAKGVSSQTADLQQWQNSAGTVGLAIKPGGVIDFSQATTPYFKGNATVGFRFNDSTDNYNLAILQDDGDMKFYAGGASIKARIHASTGAFVTGSTSANNQQLFVRPSAANVIGMAVMAASSQSEDMFQLQDSTGTKQIYTTSAFNTYIPEGKYIISGGNHLSGMASASTYVNRTTVGTYENRYGTLGDGTVYIERNYVARIGIVADGNDIRAENASDTVLRVRGAASQSGSLQKWMNSVGTQLAGFNADCTILTMPDTGFTVGGGGATHNGGYLSTIVGSYSVASGNGNMIFGANSYTQGTTAYATFLGYGHYGGGGYCMTAVGNQCLAYYDNAIAIGTQSAAFATSGGGPGAIAIGAYAYSSGANVVAFNTSPVAGSGTTLQVQGIPSVFVDYAKAIGNMSGSWIDSVLASRRGRLTLSTYEVATAQEALRIDSASDQARLGIGGAVVSGQRVTMYAGVATDVVQVLKGASSQTGDLLQTQNSVGTTLMKSTAAGYFRGPDGSAAAPTYSFADNTFGYTGIYRQASNGYLSFATNGSACGEISTSGMNVKGSGTYPGVSLNGAIFVQDMFGVGDPGGIYFATGMTAANFFNPPRLTLQRDTSPAMTVTVGTASHVPFVSRGTTSQTGDLFQGQNSVGTMLGYINKNFCAKFGLASSGDIPLTLVPSSGGMLVQSVGSGGTWNWQQGGVQSTLQVSSSTVPMYLGTGGGSTIAGSVVHLTAANNNVVSIKYNSVSELGFHGVTPVARPTAYTQTYATASRTHEALTSATLTDSTGGTANTAVQDVTAAHNQTILNNNFADLIAQINALRVDLENAKQVINSITDDLQAVGLLQ